MKRRVRTLSPTTTAASAAEMMESEGVGFLPVIGSDGRALGVVTDRDIAIRVCAKHRSAEATTVDKIMSTDLVTCLSDEPLVEAEQRMVQHRKWRILVVDGEGRFLGLVSLIDIAHVASPLKAAMLLRQLADRDYRLEGSRQVVL